jgi:predicted nucleic acid-binding protein
MKLYLDTCVWCRPFDEENERILRETNALRSILKKVDKEEVEIIGSSVLLVEVSLISFKEKREIVEELINKVSKIVFVTENSIKLAEEIMQRCKVNAMDALHLSIAAENADIFITVDDEILNKSECLSKYLSIKNPIEVSK